MCTTIHATFIGATRHLCTIILTERYPKPTASIVTFGSKTTTQTSESMFIFCWSLPVIQEQIACLRYFSGLAVHLFVAAFFSSLLQWSQNMSSQLKFAKQLPLLRPSRCFGRKTKCPAAEDHQSRPGNWGSQEDGRVDSLNLTAH